VGRRFKKYSLCTATTLPSCVADLRPVTDAGDVQSKQVQYPHYLKSWRLLIFGARKLLFRRTDPLDDLTRQSANVRRRLV
jgi:hypothetical protein